MITIYTILAAHSHFNGYYEESFDCTTLWAAMKQFRKYQKQGYEIIDLRYRETIKIDFSNWNQITMTDWGE